MFSKMVPCRFVWVGCKAQTGYACTQESIPQCVLELPSLQMHWRRLGIHAVYPETADQIAGNYMAQASPNPANWVWTGSGLSVQHLNGADSTTNTAPHEQHQDPAHAT